MLLGISFLPADTPQRALLILIAFVVAAGTLLVHGGTLGWLVRLLGKTKRSPDAHQEQLFELRRELAETVTERLDENDLTKPDGSPFSPLAIEWTHRIIASSSPPTISAARTARICAANAANSVSH